MPETFWYRSGCVEYARAMARLDDIKAAVLELPATGPNGFEGLLAAVLEQIAGQPFRLARSGLQAGRDGDTLDQGAHLSFECKLYTGSLSSTDVQAKITQLLGSANPPDVWAFAATAEAGSQLVATIRTAATRSGLGILVLDWPETSAFPPLAVALGLAMETTISFLASNGVTSSIVDRAKAALESLRAEGDFSVQAQPIVLEVRASSLGMANATAANAEWLTDKFSDRAKARAAFGQALSPQADLPLPLRSREGLSGPIKSHLLGTPAKSVLAVVGGEGHGKSWLVAEAWLALDNRPLMVVVPAADMIAVAAYGEFRPFLIKHIIRQSSELEDDRVGKRWERRLKAWAEQPPPEQPRFNLWIDGLNEQPAFEWRRWLDDVATQVTQLGGVLVITVREAFFNERISRSLNVPITRVNVPVWTAAELNDLLMSQGVDPQQVAAPVLEQLRNPRILGIASRLLSNAQIQSFTELSTGRLLYEHIRASAVDGTVAETPEVFGGRLAAHARQVIDRMRSQEHDDALVFDQHDATGTHVLTASTLANTADLFFSALPGEPRLYTLPDGALGLALGLAILEALRRAERNGRNVEETLNELLEPIAALDRTADAVHAALLVASFDDQLSLAIKAALIIGFTALQNVDDAYYRPFVGIVRAAPEAALIANEQLLVTERSAPNHFWITNALREARNDRRCAPVIDSYVRRWLSTYSLDPRLGVITRVRDEGQEAYDAKVAEQEEKLLVRRSNLTQTEVQYLERRLVRNDDGNPGNLQVEACEILAGARLAPFASEIVACAFSHALNSSYRDAYNELISLVRFNKSDWSETRDALLEAARFLAIENASKTANWAHVHVLRALSRIEDAELAERLVEELTADREKFGPWRRVENYSASDPCDPNSAESENVADAARAYEEIPVAELTKSRSMGMADHDFKDARPAMARFRPQVALTKLREYALSTVGREARLRQIAVCSLEPFASGLNQQTVTQLLSLAAELSAPSNPQSQASRYSWVTTQYAIQITFPHLSGDEQVDFLTALRSPGSPLVKFADVLKPTSPDKLARLLARALESNEANNRLIALSVARASGTPLNDASRASIVSLLDDDHSPVRAVAMDVIAHADDPLLFKAFAAKAWSAASLNPSEQSYERWYGSLAKIEAAKGGFCSTDGLFDHIIPALFGFAAERLGQAVEGEIAARIHAAATRALQVEIPYSPPRATQRASENKTPRFGFLDVVEPEGAGGLEAFVERANETDEQFDARHKSYRESFRQFESSVSAQDARLIIEDVGDSAISALLNAEPVVALDIARKLLAADRRQAYRLTNFGLRLAKGVSVTHPNLARELFDRFASETGVITYTFGASSIPLAALSVWEAAEGPELDALRRRRLDQASSDHEIAQEVVAALMAGKPEFLEDYARAKLQSPIPADNARGIMVLGFGQPSPYADEILSGSAASEGLLGNAHRAARYAYERNIWARTWFDRMLCAETAEDFWANSVLLLKIVDGRFDLWVWEAPPLESIAASFLPSIADALRRRTNSWKTHRDKTLYGDKMPAAIFLGPVD